MSRETGQWPSTIVFVDMDAFFASIEQAENPDFTYKPLAVTNGLMGTCIITCSYEARAHGIHTGMRIKEARKLCPDLIQRPANPERYAQVSTHIMDTLYKITPDVEVFSVDEAFLDVTRCQRLWGTPAEIGHMVKQRVREASGLRCSIGVSGDKSTAKFAGKQEKPDGLTIIPPWEARGRLKNEPVMALCGVNRGIASFLAKRGAVTCGDVAKLPISVLGQRFGNPGRRIWYMCQGADPEKVKTNIDAPKTVGHGKVVPPDTRDRDTIYMYLIHMAEKVGQRLRLHALHAQKYFVGLRCMEGWVGGKFKTRIPVNDSRPIIKLCKQVMSQCWKGEGVYQVNVTALDPRPEKGQIDLFSAPVSKFNRLNKAMDLINDRYGEFCIAPAQLLNRSSMPNVIAPAWKPYGHRQTILSTRPKAKTDLVKKIYTPAK